MLSFAGNLKLFVAVEPYDMRKGFNGLPAAVTERLGEDPKGGGLFVFCNRRRHQTTFSIPIGPRRDCISVASPAWATVARDPQKRKEGERGH